MPSLLEAIEGKYGPGGSCDPQEAHVSISVPKLPPRLLIPDLLVLNGCDIDCAGEPDELRKKCCNVRELDLAKNKLKSWKEIFSILSHMPRVEFVNLSLNLLSGPVEPPPDFEHTRVQKLVLSCNPVPEWHEICRLGRVFPKLESLVLAEYPLEAVEDIPRPGSSSSEWDDSNSESEDPPHEYFQNLECLNLSETEIYTWDDIDRLAEFPSLRHLHVRNWPLWDECDAVKRRQLLIARLPFVQPLNGSVISSEEREDAERAFIRYYFDKPGADRPERYNELIGVHPEWEPKKSFFEGILIRKRVLIMKNLKNAYRPWDKVYVVARNSRLTFFKNRKASRAQPEQSFRGERPLSLEGASVDVANLTERKHVFKIKFAIGLEISLQARNEAELQRWMGALTAQSQTAL